MGPFFVGDADVVGNLEVLEGDDVHTEKSVFSG